MQAYSSGRPRVHIGSREEAIERALAEYEEKMPGNAELTRVLEPVCADLREELGLREADAQEGGADEYPGGRDGEPTDDEIYNGPGVEGGIVYVDDAPGSLGENDHRL